MTDRTTAPVAAANEYGEMVDAAAKLARLTAQAAAELERADLAARATVAATRVTRPSVLACVVGEFKQGKSALVNAVLGRAVCPVDDDLATATVTLVHHADTVQAVVRQREKGQLLVLPIEPGELADYVTEAANPDNVRRVERVEIGVPVELLSEGLTLVDTPGMGGLGSSTTAATLGFLPYADALLFVSDASAELSAPELEFLVAAADACPTVYLCLSKTDIYPEWRRIAGLNEGHLRRAGLEISILPVSSMVRVLGLQRGDATFDRESGIPALVDLLRSGVFAPAKRVAAARAVVEATLVTGQLLEGLRAEQASLEDDTATGALLASLEDAKARLDHLRGAGARWSVVLNDSMTDLNTRITHRFRDGLRAVHRAADTDAESVKSVEQWDPIAQRLQRDVAEIVSATFRDVDAEAAVIAGDIADLVKEEAEGILDGIGEPLVLDVDSLFYGRSIDPRSGSAVGRTFNDTLTVLRGAQGGIIMLGMAGGLLPAAAGVLLSAPITLGLGAVFAGHAMIEHRKRKLNALQQQVRTAVRQFLDEVQFQFGDELVEQTRAVHRQLRDHFGDRISELLRTHTETARRLQENARRTQHDRDARLDVVRTAVPELEALEQKLRLVGAQL